MAEVNSSDRAENVYYLFPYITILPIPKSWEQIMFNETFQDINVKKKVEAKITFLKNTQCHSELKTYAFFSISVVFAYLA